MGCGGGGVGVGFGGGARPPPDRGYGGCGGEIEPYFSKAICRALT